MPELESDLEGLAGPQSPVDARAAMRRGSTLRRRRRAGRVAGGLALVGVLLLGAVALRLPGGGGEQVQTMQGVLAGEETWQQLPAGPADGRTGASTVWTGDEFIIWGGMVDGATVATGAAYSPAAGTWRELGQAPIPARADHVAVWMDGEMFVCCGNVDPQSPNAAYDPGTDTWRLLEGQSELQTISDAAGAWTGSQVVVAGGTAVVSQDGALTYDLTTDSWVGMSEMSEGILGPSPDVQWTGTELMVVPRVETLSSPEAFDPQTGTWRIVQDPLPVIGSPSGVWTGSELLLWGLHPEPVEPLMAQSFGLSVFADEGFWQPMRPAPLTPVPVDSSDGGSAVQGSNSAVWDGSRGRMILYTGGFGADVAQAGVPAPGATAVFTYDPVDDRWEVLPPLPLRDFHPPMTLADDLLIVGSGPFWALDLATTATTEPLDPMELTAEDPVAPQVIPITDPETGVAVPGTLAPLQGGTPLTQLGRAPPDEPAFEPSTPTEESIVEAVHQTFGGGGHEADASGFEDPGAIEAQLDEGEEQYPQYAEGLSSIVWDVEIVGDTEAAVVFDVVDAGLLVTATTRGRVVLVDGDWQVSNDTVCEMMGRAGIDCP